MSERDEELSPAERQALQAWQVPEPPVDFEARVLAAAGPSRSHGRQLAVAALALVLVGGFFAARLLTGGASTFGEVHVAPSGDGGPGVEASPLTDGVRS